MKFKKAEVSIMDVEVEELTKYADASYVGNNWISRLWDYDDLFTHITTGVYDMAREGSRGKGINIAVIDTGVDQAHKMLSGKVISHNDFCSTDDELAVDDNGHGTHVASIIVGKGIGAEDAKIRSFKVLDANGSGTLSDIADALEYIVGRCNLIPSYVDIVNMSLGISGLAKLLDPVNFERMHNAIKELTYLDIPVIVASGNTGMHEYMYPASFPEVISVGATSWRRIRQLFSTINDEVDLMQCGSAVFGALPNNRYAKMSGTSMACPMVTKIAVLLLGKYKKLFSKPMPEPELFSILNMNTVDMGAIGVDIVYGVGFCSLKPAYGQMSIHYRPNGEVEIRENYVGYQFPEPYVKPHINADSRFVMGFRDSFEFEGNIGFWLDGEVSKDADGNPDPQGIIII